MDLKLFPLPPKLKMPSILILIFLVKKAHTFSNGKQSVTTF